MADSLWERPNYVDLVPEEDPISDGLWEVDGDDISSIDSGTDPYWEIDGNDIIPLWEWDDSIWEEDENGDLTLKESPSTTGLWEVDSDDILPVNSGTDLYWVLDGDDIVPLWGMFVFGEGEAVGGGLANVIIKEVEEIPTGGGAAGGVSTVFNKFVFSTSGGAVAGAEPITVFYHRVVVSSVAGGVAGGTATLKFIDITEVSGGGVGGGAAIASNKVVWLASGGGVAGGTSQYKFTGLYQWYRGTVTVTNGSDVVTGKDTKWNLYIQEGQTFKIKDEPVIYIIKSVDGDEQLTLETTYKGETKTDYEYQVTRGFTSTMQLGGIFVGDKDIQQHMTLEFIRKIEEIFGTMSTPQFTGIGISDGTISQQETVTTLTSVESDTWYDVLTISSSFSAIVEVNYKDSTPSYDRTCIVHIGGYNGGTCTPTYISRPNGNDIEVRLDSGKLQVKQTAHSGGIMTITVNYIIHS